MPTNESSEEIIEKRDASPVASTFLILSGLGLLGAMSLQVAEISALTRHLSSADRAHSYADVRTFERSVAEILQSSEIDEEDITAVEEVLKSPGKGRLSEAERAAILGEGPEEEAVEEAEEPEAEAEEPGEEPAEALEEPAEEGAGE